jgi:hypothetical protein
MPDLTLKLETEGEPLIEGWHLADGHWDLATGIGVILIVSPEQRARILAGLDLTGLQTALRVSRHCAETVVDRQVEAVRLRAMQQ